MITVPLLCLIYLQTIQAVVSPPTIYVFDNNDERRDGLSTAAIEGIFKGSSCKDNCEFETFDLKTVAVDSVVLIPPDIQQSQFDALKKVQAKMILTFLRPYPELTEQKWQKANLGDFYASLGYQSPCDYNIQETFEPIGSFFSNNDTYSEQMVAEKISKRNKEVAIINEECDGNVAQDYVNDFNDKNHKFKFKIIDACPGRQESRETTAGRLQDFSAFALFTQWSCSEYFPEVYFMKQTLSVPFLLDKRSGLNKTMSSSFLADATFFNDTNAEETYQNLTQTDPFHAWTRTYKYAPTYRPGLCELCQEINNNTLKKRRVDERLESYSQCTKLTGPPKDMETTTTAPTTERAWINFKLDEKLVFVSTGLMFGFVLAFVIVAISLTLISLRHKWFRKVCPNEKQAPPAPVFTIDPPRD